MTRLRTVKPALVCATSSIAPATGAEPFRRSTSWYNTARWRKLRLMVLARDGYQCQQTGVMLSGRYPADNSPVVDHKRPHRGDPEMFWDDSNLEAVAKGWHDKTKQSLEKRGLV